MRAPSNLSSADYAAAVQRNPTYGMLVPVGSSGGQAVAPNSATVSQGSGVTTNQGSGLSPTEVAAKNTLSQFANDPGSAGLKLQLAQEGVSLTDNSDVGPGRRFETYVEKLQFVMAKKMAYVIAMRLSMVGGGGWGPSGMTEAIKDAKADLYGTGDQNVSASDNPEDEPEMAHGAK